MKRSLSCVRLSLHILAAMCVLHSAGAWGQSRVWRQGLSLFGELKYPPDFRHFDYVNANAPRTGKVRLASLGTFDNFNIILGGIKGRQPVSLNVIYDTLTTYSLDEPSAVYGLLAEAISHPDDYSSVTFRLRQNATWHDGTVVTPEDVIFSFHAFKENNPRYALFYQHVIKVEQTGTRDVTFRFDVLGNRELPLIVGDLYVLPKHWYEGVDPAGNRRDVTKTSLEPPLSSGAYRIREFKPGHTIVYERVQDYWAGDLPVNVGRNNFDEIHYDYFQNALAAFEAFKADQLDWFLEYSAKDWATAYDFSAVLDKRVLKEEFPIRSSGGMQALVMNLRRQKFSDSRVRRAFNLVLDFEEMNRTFFFGQYKRIASYFEGTELASSGLPSGLELDILETIRGKVPTEVFSTEYTNPINGSPEARRNNLREATQLLREAGYEIRNQELVDLKTSQQMIVELLNTVADPHAERLLLFYKNSLERLGVKVTLRTVDETQFENRKRTRDFDIILGSWETSLSPGNEQREYWGSKAADRKGSHNYSGIQDSAVDELINQVVFANSRERLVAASRALDRVMLWGNYVVPLWTYGRVRTARWDRFGHPDPLPKYGAAAFPTLWWLDPLRQVKTRY